VVTALVVLWAAVVASPVRAADGWTWPVAGASASSVTRSYAPPQVRYGAGHRGVDLGSVPGAPVLAAGAGRVSYAGLLAGRGVVVVQHGDLRTTYEPVTAQVAVGQQVAPGEVLGALDPGHAGCPVPACLHWGLRRGEAYLDPLSLVGAGPVRLLPVLEQAPAAGAAPPAERPEVDRPAVQGSGVQEQPAAGAPGFDLRSAATPSGALALAALLAGLALLVRPRPPHRPTGAAVASGDAPRVPAEPHDDRPPAQVLDLVGERARRAAQQ
jgi:murein DD-endopeptidase MepM/ murein hydrolase activator NlpD